MNGPVPTIQKTSEAAEQSTVVTNTKTGQHSISAAAGAKMLSFFASPDLRKFRGKQKKSEPSVKLKHVMWNNTELSRENEIVDKKPSSHTDSIDSIVLLRQHSSISSGSNNVRDSEDSWVSQQGSGGAFWFLRNRHDKFLGSENLKQSKSSIDESEEYLNTEESESIYATKVGFYDEAIFH